MLGWRVSWRSSFREFEGVVVGEEGDSLRVWELTDGELLSLSLRTHTHLERRAAAVREYRDFHRREAEKEEKEEKERDRTVSGKQRARERERDRESEKSERAIRRHEKVLIALQRLSASINSSSSSSSMGTGVAAKEYAMRRDAAAALDAERELLKKAQRERERRLRQLRLADYEDSDAEGEKDREEEEIESDIEGEEEAQEVEECLSHTHTERGAESERKRRPSNKDRESDPEDSAEEVEDEEEDDNEEDDSDSEEDDDSDDDSDEDSDEEYEDVKVDIKVRVLPQQLIRGFPRTPLNAEGLQEIVSLLTRDYCNGPSAAQTLTLVYTDEDGDDVHIVSASDLVFAVRACKREQKAKRIKDVKIKLVARIETTPARSSPSKQRGEEKEQERERESTKTPRRLSDSFVTTEFPSSSYKRTSGPAEEKERESFIDTARPILWKQGALLGSGSFGQVFAGISLTTGDKMAIKEVEIQRSKRSQHTTPPHNTQCNRITFHTSHHAETKHGLLSC